MADERTAEQVAADEQMREAVKAVTDEGESLPRGSQSSGGKRRRSALTGRFITPKR